MFRHFWFDIRPRYVELKSNQMTCFLETTWVSDSINLYLVHSQWHNSYVSFFFYCADMIKRKVDDKYLYHRSTHYHDDDSLRWRKRIKFALAMTIVILIVMTSYMKEHFFMSSDRASILATKHSSSLEIRHCCTELFSRIRGFWEKEFNKELSELNTLRDLDLSFAPSFLPSSYCLDHSYVL